MKWVWFLGIFVVTLNLSSNVFSTHYELKEIPSIGQNVFVVITVKENTKIEEFRQLLKFYVDVSQFRV